MVDWLMDRAKDSKGELDGLVAIALDPAGEPAQSWNIGDLCDDDAARRKKIKERIIRTLSGATLVVHAGLAGLDPQGLLDNGCRNAPPTAENGGPEWAAVPFRVRVVKPEDETSRADSEWLERYRVAWKKSDEGDPIEWLIVDKRKQTSTNEHDRATSPQEQSLEDHQDLAQDKAAQIASRLGLPEPYPRMLAVAAALHDEGKRSSRWQRAFNAPAEGGPYAKTRGPINQVLLARYRHELASARYAANNAMLQELPLEVRDLALHLIAAHHGGARPVIGAEGFDDLPQSQLTGLAQEVALRYVRLQRRWGPWGLAWWESLLRAADQQASRELDRQEPA
ncbi:MAG: CRISPR-associated endonuclease Cas3'' [Bryobacteraceae bacterium]